VWSRRPARWLRLKNPVSSRGIFLLATTKLEAQEDIALAITSAGLQSGHFKTEVLIDMQAKP
jgi:hypothetical protein